MLMAMARLNLPSVYLYGGTILPGTYQGRDITIQDVFEAVGAHANGTIERRGAAGDRARRLPDHRVVRRHVHGEHDGRGGRGARHVAARRARRPPAVDYRREVVRARVRAAGRAAARRATVRGRATS